MHMLTGSKRFPWPWLPRLFLIGVVVKVLRATMSLNDSSESYIKLSVFARPGFEEALLQPGIAICSVVP